MSGTRKGEDARPAAAPGAPRRERDALHQPGDGLGQAFGEDPKRIAAVVYRKLPAAARALFANAPWEAVHPEFVGKRFRRRRADLVYRARLRSGKTLYVLVELKSTLDIEVLAQLIVYREALLRRHRRLHPEDPDAGALLVVLYSGEEEWDLSGAAVAEEQVLALFEPGTLGYLPLDLRREDLDALCFEPKDKGACSETYSVVRALTWDGSGTDAEMVRVIEGTKPGSALEGHVFDFLWPRMSDAQLDIRYALRPHLKEKSMDCVQLNQAIGEARERKTMLQEMLEAFFGPLPESARQRIDGATPEQLKSWALSVRDAGSVDDVLNGTGR